MLTALRIVLLCLLGLSPPAWAVLERITAIRFEGNRVTEDRILRQELPLRVGDAVDPKMIAKARQAVMDLGLFKSVEVALEEEPAVPGGRIVVFTVEEKYYILPIPRLDADPDGSYKYGAELRFDNLGGLNQRLKLELASRDEVDEDGALEQEISASYRYPRIGGSRFNLGAEASVEREEFGVTSETGGEAQYREDFRRVGASLSRWVDTLGPSRGWLVGGALTLEQRDFTHLSGDDGLYEDDQAVTLSASVMFDALHDHGYYRSGGVTGVRTDLGLAELGSDYFYTRTLLYYRRYHAYGGGHNLNWRLQIGLANGEKFGSPAYDLGGDKSLRGYDSGLVEGNAMLLGNVEYLKPLYGTLRGVLFADVGNVYEGVMESDLTDLRTGVGFGLRWDVTWFVDATLRADVAYGLASQETHTYVGTSRTF